MIHTLTWKLTRLSGGWYVEEVCGNASGRLLSDKGEWSVIGKRFDSEEEAAEFARGQQK